MEITDTIDPKVDQLTADHLIGRTLTIRVTAVRLAAGEQPCEIQYEGDNGLPYRPGKSMRRVLVHAWGGDVSRYVGRSMRLYRDDDVQFGGLKVGGIRISHMSHIAGPLTLALTNKKGSKKAFKVLPLVEEAPGPDGWPVLAPDGSLKSAPNAAKWHGWCRVAIGKLESVQALDGWLAGMEPHFVSLAEFDALAVRAVQADAGDRRVDLMMARDAEP